MIEVTFSSLIGNWNRVRFVAPVVPGYDILESSPGEVLHHYGSERLLIKSGPLSYIVLPSGDIECFWYTEEAPGLPRGTGLCFGIRVRLHLEIFGLGWAPEWFYFLDQGAQSWFVDNPKSQPWDGPHKTTEINDTKLKAHYGVGSKVTPIVDGDDLKLTVVLG